MNNKNPAASLNMNKNMVQISDESNRKFLKKNPKFCYGFSPKNRIPPLNPHTLRSILQIQEANRVQSEKDSKRYITETI